ncbi:hypothetical protein SOVF_189410, partial [Spinacia oleracea]
MSGQGESSGSGRIRVGGRRGARGGARGSPHIIQPTQDQGDDMNQGDFDSEILPETQQDKEVVEPRVVLMTPGELCHCLVILAPLRLSCSLLWLPCPLGSRSAYNKKLLLPITYVNHGFNPLLSSPFFKIILEVLVENLSQLPLVRFIFSKGAASISIEIYEVNYGENPTNLILFNGDYVLLLWLANRKINRVSEIGANYFFYWTTTKSSDSKTGKCLIFIFTGCFVVLINFNFNLWVACILLVVLFIDLICRVLYALHIAINGCVSDDFPVLDSQATAFTPNFAPYDNHYKYRITVAATITPPPFLPLTQTFLPCLTRILINSCLLYSCLIFLLSKTMPQFLCRTLLRFPMDFHLPIYVILQLQPYNNALTTPPMGSHNSSSAPTSPFANSTHSPAAEG